MRSEFQTRSHVSLSCQVSREALKNPRKSTPRNSPDIPADLLRMPLIRASAGVVHGGTGLEGTEQVCLWLKRAIR